MLAGPIAVSWQEAADVPAETFRGLARVRNPPVKIDLPSGLQTPGPAGCSLEPIRMESASDSLYSQNSALASPRSPTGKSGDSRIAEETCAEGFCCR
jgi:hypothetical protein